MQAAPDHPPAADPSLALRLALEAAGMVVWSWDLRTGTVDYSENMDAVTRGPDYSTYCAITSILPTVHPDDRANLEAALERTRTTGCIFDCEYRVRMQDGVFRWIHGQGKHVVFENGRPVRVLGVSQDVTERKHAEAELQLRSHQLARLASELTLTEHRERQRLAEVLHEHVQQLLAGARLQVFALAAGESRERQERHLAVLATLDETLDLLRAITRGLAPPALPQRDAALWLSWVARDVEKRHGLKVTVSASGETDDLEESVRVLLFSAARELLLNVAKHAGTAAAALALHRTPGLVVLEVQDAGRGLERDQAGSAPSQGFGLFSIRERTELLGGRVEVSSDPGHGTRVTVSLPIGAPDRPGAAGATA